MEMKPHTHSVGIIQMTSANNPSSNFHWIRQQATILKQQGAQLIVTPENAIICGSRNDYHRYAEHLNSGEWQTQASELARELEVWLVIGSFPIISEQGVSTTLLVFNSSGELVEHYDKLHLFDADITDSHQAYRESHTFSYGNRLTSIDSPVGQLGLTVCYDLRFPDLYQSLRSQGANVIIVPAAFTEVTGEAHWELLLKARAIETQSWIIAAAQGGTHEDGRKTWGHSMVVNPWGEIVASLEQESGQKHNQQQNGYLIANIDHTMTNSVRNKMPLTQHCRFTRQLVNK